jgi:nitrogen fixation protein NifQ
MDRPDPELMLRAIAAVLWHAQEGHLPLFSWTLGLRQPNLLAMVQTCFPELDSLEPMPETQYAAVLNTTPVQFRFLTGMLRANRSPKVDARHADWVARAVAAASMGSRHLWEDLGLSGRDDVSWLLAHYFKPLFNRNVDDLKWKKFLYAELGRLQSQPDLRPPNCAECEQFTLCFGAEPIRNH